MIDIQILRKDTDGVAVRLASRGYTLDTEAFRALEAERKDVQTRTEALQARRNALSKSIGQLKAKGQDTAAVMAEVAGLGDELKASAEQNDRLLARLDAFLLTVPNLPHDSVPIGDSEAGNVEARRWSPGGTGLCATRPCRSG